MSSNDFIQEYDYWSYRGYYGIDPTDLADLYVSRIEYIAKEKLKDTHHEPVHELTLSGSLSKHTKPHGNGGRTSSTL